jgi:hypothetical protein
MKMTMMMTRGEGADEEEPAGKITPKAKNGQEGWG